MKTEVLSIFFNFIFCRFYYYLTVHISSYITVYDMYVLQIGVIKNNNNINKAGVIQVKYFE